MAMATGITDLAGAPHLITAGKPESRARKSGHPEIREPAGPEIIRAPDLELR
jgi:hypothetical protein